MEVVKKVFFIFQQNWPFLGSTLRELTINISLKFIEGEANIVANTISWLPKEEET